MGIWVYYNDGMSLDYMDSFRIVPASKLFKGYKNLKDEYYCIVGQQVNRTGQQIVLETYSSLKEAKEKLYNIYSNISVETTRTYIF